MVTEVASVVVKLSVALVPDGIEVGAAGGGGGGGGSRTLKPPGRVADWPSGLSTTTSWAPTVAAALMRIMALAELADTTLHPATIPSPKEQVAPGRKLLPVMVTTC